MSTEKELYDRQTDAFLSWAVQQGITLNPKIKLVDLRQLIFGRAVCSLTVIEADEDLFTVPRSAILTPQTSALANEISSELEDPWLALILVLIYEHQQGSESAWKPYLDVLPTSFDTLMYWDEAELNELKGSAVLSKIGKEKANQTFTDEVIPIIRKHKAAFNATSTSDDDLLALCHRMGSTIMAYAFDLEKPSNENDESTNDDGWEVASDEDGSLPVGMIPMADMLNANGDENNAKLFYEDDKVVMRSTKRISPKHEILNDYGEIPMADLLRRYGYITEKYAKYNVVEVGQQVIFDTDTVDAICPHEDLRQRLDYLATEMDVDAFDIAHAGAEGGQIPPELKAVVRCLLMSKDEFDKLRSEGKKMPSDKPFKAGEDQALRILLLIMYERRNDYAAEPEKKKKKVVSQVLDLQDLPLEELHDTKTRRKHMAHRVIAGEKAVLEEAIESILDMLGPFKATKRHQQQPTQPRKKQRT